MEAKAKKMRVKQGTHHFWRVLFSRKVIIVCAAVVLLFCLVAVLAPVIAPYDPNEQDLYNLLAEPGGTHLLGTDALGRDVLSRIIYGARVSLLVGIVAVGIACVIGTLLGMSAAYFGGVVDALVMRVSEALRAIPAVVLAIALVAVFGSGLRNVAIILGVSTVPGYVLMMRAQVLSIKSRDYIVAARLQGGSSLRIMFTHILPNCLSPLIVMMTQQVGQTILAEAGLSFLGVGISAPTASWGAMVSEGKNILLQNPIVGLAPGICVAILVICLNTFGDGVRDALDPRLRGEV